MFNEKTQLPYHNTKKPKTLLLISRKNQLSLSTILLSNVNKTQKKHQSDHSLTKYSPIHTPLHLQLPKKTSPLHLNETSEISFSQRQLKDRISKFNKFNHRNFGEESPTKEGLLFKNSRKCKSNPAKKSIQSAIQCAITKKQITSKEISIQDSQSLWYKIKENKQHPGHINSFYGIKRTNTKNQKHEYQFNKMRQTQMSSQYLKKCGMKKLQHHKSAKKHFLSSLGQHKEIRPWNHTKILLTSPSASVRNSLDYKQKIGEHF